MSPLAGRGIVITRPVQESQLFAGRIAEAGGVPFLFPAIEIRLLRSAGLEALGARLAEFDHAVFISPSAVNAAWDLLPADAGWPAHTVPMAVGAGSMRALVRRGVAPDRILSPAERYDSEALLALPELQDMAGRRVLIFRGRGGRELLADTLRARGAQVTYAECYERAMPQTDAAPLIAAHARGALHALTLTSSEGARNVHTLLGGATGPQRRLLTELPVFASHPRIAEAARSLGAQQVITTDQGDDGVLAGLLAWFGNARG